MMSAEFVRESTDEAKRIAAALERIATAQEMQFLQARTEIDDMAFRAVLAYADRLADSNGEQP